MKKMLLVVVVLTFIKKTSGQNGFKDCFKNILVRMDSLHKAGQPLNWGEWKNCVLGKPMPAFTGVTVSGDTIKMKELKGKIVVINFWFIDCHPCIAELSGLNDLVEDYKNKDIGFLSITRETVKRLQSEFFPKHKLDFTVISLDDKEINSMMASGYPTTYIVDQQGIINTAWNGGRTDEKAGLEFYKNAKSAIDKLAKTE